MQTVGGASIAKSDGTDLKATSPGKGQESLGQGYTMANIRIDDHNTMGATRRRSLHRKAPTVAHNGDYDMLMRARSMAEVQDFTMNNVNKLRTMSSGRPLKERMDIPDGVDVFQYGNQKLNIWEF